MQHQTYLQGAVELQVVSLQLGSAKLQAGWPAARRRPVDGGNRRQHAHHKRAWRTRQHATRPATLCTQRCAAPPSQAAACREQCVQAPTWMELSRVTSSPTGLSARCIVITRMNLIVSFTTCAEQGSLPRCVCVRTTIISRTRPAHVRGWLQHKRQKPTCRGSQPPQRLMQQARVRAALRHAMAITACADPRQSAPGSAGSGRRARCRWCRCV